MEVAENAQNKVQNETSDIHKSPIKDNVDNGGGDIAANNKAMEINDVQKTPKSRKMTKLERMSQENAALLKELGVNPSDDNADSGRRRTRSQARGVTTPPAPVEEKPKRGRKSKEDSDSSSSNKKSAPPPPVEAGQKRGRGRPPKNVPSAKKLKENDKVVEDNVAETENEKKEESVQPELNKHEVDDGEKKVEELEKKEEEKVSPMVVTSPEKPKEEPEPTTTTDTNTEQKTNGEEKKSSENCSEPQAMDTKPSEGNETLTTPNENEN